MSTPIGNRQRLAAHVALLANAMGPAGCHEAKNPLISAGRKNRSWRDRLWSDLRQEYQVQGELVGLGHWVMTWAVRRRFDPGRPPARRPLRSADRRLPLRAHQPAPGRRRLDPPVARTRPTGRPRPQRLPHARAHPHPSRRPLRTDQRTRQPLLDLDQQPPLVPLFPNPVAAESLLDRLINNSHQFFMSEASYKLPTHQ